MITNILIGLLAYGIFLIIFFIGWIRMCKKNEQYDAAMHDATGRNDV